MDGIPHNEDGTGGDAPLHAVVARQQEARFPARVSHRDWRRPADAERRDSAAGIHNFTPTDVASHPRAFGGYGKELKDDYRRLYGATVNFAGAAR
jgi:hypothetical protein